MDLPDLPFPGATLTNDTRPGWKKAYREMKEVWTPSCAGLIILAPYVRSKCFETHWQPPCRLSLALLQINPVATNRWGQALAVATFMVALAGLISSFLSIYILGGASLCQDTVRLRWLEVLEPIIIISCGYILLTRACLFISIGLSSAWRNSINPVLVVSSAPSCVCCLVSFLKSGCAARVDIIRLGRWFLQLRQFCTSPSRQPHLLQKQGTIASLRKSLTVWALLLSRPWTGTSSFKFTISSKSWHERGMFGRSIEWNYLGFPQ